MDINGCCERSALLVYARNLLLSQSFMDGNWTMLHIGPDSLPIPGSCVAARAPGTLSSPTPRAAAVHAPHNVGGARGSEVSLGRFL